MNGLPRDPRVRGRLIGLVALQAGTPQLIFAERRPGNLVRRIGDSLDDDPGNRGEFGYATEPQVQSAIDNPHPVKIQVQRPVLAGLLKDIHPVDNGLPCSLIPKIRFPAAA